MCTSVVARFELFCYLKYIQKIFSWVMFLLSLFKKLLPHQSQFFAVIVITKKLVQVWQNKSIFEGFKTLLDRICNSWQQFGNSLGVHFTSRQRVHSLLEIKAGSIHITNHFTYQLSMRKCFGSTVTNETCCMWTNSFLKREEVLSTNQRTKRCVGVIWSQTYSISLFYGFIISGKCVAACIWTHFYTRHTQNLSQNGLRAYREAHNSLILILKWST